MKNPECGMTNSEFCLPRYDRYKDSGVEWLGEIPEHWQSEKGKWLFLKMDRQVRPEDGVVTAFRDGQVTLRTNRRTDGFTNAIKEHGYQGIRKGDLVIHAMDAFAGAIGVSESDGKSTPVYSACVPRKPNTVTPQLYAYLLRYMAHSGFITTLAKGIRERSTDFRFNDFGALDLPLPPKSEQDRIVAFLDQKTAEIDALIAKKQRQIELLDEQKAILINRAVTRGLNPNAKLKPSGIEWIGDIPVHWEVKPGLTYFKETDVRSITGDEELLSVSHLTGVTPRSEKNITMFMAESYEGSKLCEIGDIAVNTMWAWMAALGVSKYRGLVSPSYNTYRQKLPNPYQPEFLDLLLRSNPYTGHYFINSTGITTSRLRLYPHPFLRLKFIRPPDSEQKKIVDYCSKASGLIATSKASVTKQIESLRALRSTLIAHAVTGRIKV